MRAEIHPGALSEIILRATENECLDLVKVLEAQTYEGFDLYFNVLVDAASSEYHINVLAINLRDPDSSDLPKITLPPGWKMAEFWYAASAAGAHIGSIWKVG
jgi:hypothetical protein